MPNKYWDWGLGFGIGYCAKVLGELGRSFQPKIGQKSKIFQ
jgi:hypothetical protein